MSSLQPFIVFEGIDGAGTTTQAKRLVDLFCRAGADALFTCEPTDLPTGALIRTILAGDDSVQPETLALLFAADRREHLYHPDRGVLATIRAGSTVVCDRYLFSSLAYQGVTTDPTLVELLNSQFPLPRHLVFIDTSLEESDRRMSSRPRRDRLEEESLQRRVASRYRQVIDRYQDRIAVHRIDGNQDEATVFADIVAALADDFPVLSR